MYIYIYIYRFETCGTVAFFEYHNPLSYTALGGDGDIDAKPEAGDSGTCWDLFIYLYIYIYIANFPLGLKFLDVYIGPFRTVLKSDPETLFLLSKKGSSGHLWKLSPKWKMANIYIYIYRFDTCGTVAFFEYDNPLSYTALGGDGDIETKPDTGDFGT